MFKIELSNGKIPDPANGTAASLLEFPAVVLVMEVESDAEFIGDLLALGEWEMVSSSLKSLAILGFVCVVSNGLATKRFPLGCTFGSVGN